MALEFSRPNTSVECLVLSVDANEGTFQPVHSEQLALVPAAPKDALLTFEYRSQLITLRGTARREDAQQELRFSVTDRVLVPQRRKHARVDVALPVRAFDAGGDSVQTVTRDVSADGLQIDAIVPESPEPVRIELSLPDGQPGIACWATVVRNVAGGTAMRFANLGDADRERLRKFVRERKREILKDLRADNG